MKRFWLVTVATLALAGCGSEEHSDIKQWMKEATKDVRGKVPPLPEIKPFPAVSYDAGDITDPFRASKIDAMAKPGEGANKPDLNRRKEELEKYPLESLKFVGLLRNDKSLYAVIVADKKIYRAQVGNYIGENYGRIREIQASPGLDEGRLVLDERVQEPSGDWTMRETILEMQVQETKK
jgi:type IV pilus assembly protein PilP